MIGNSGRALALLVGLACVGAAVAMVVFLPRIQPVDGPIPGRTPINHVFVIMKENHAFDNYFGTFPGADGIPSNVFLPDGRGGTVSPHWINGSATPDLPHSREAMIYAWNNGSNDGFAIIAETWGEGLGNLSMGYYDDRQLPYYWSLARTYALADRYFTPIFGPTIPNRLYSISGTSGGLSTNEIDTANLDLPTVFDQLEGRGISWRYYYSPFPPYLPLLHYFPHIAASPQMTSRIQPMDTLIPDLQAGRVAQVTYIDPAANLTISEHAPGDVTTGEAWTKSVIDAIMAMSPWNSTAVFLTMDESGGFYDHVSPPQVDEWGYGFRIPFILVSPYARGGWIDHTVMDHTSILRFISNNWGLPPLSDRQATASDLSSMFEFPASVGGPYRDGSVLVARGMFLKQVQGVFAEAVPGKSSSQE